MKKSTTYLIESVDTKHSTVSDFLMLVKGRLTLMVVITSLMGFGIASSLQVTGLSLVILFIGGFCVAGASNALNQVLEKDYDSQMARTADRPVAAGRMSISTAVMISGLLSLVGITVLALFNPLTAFLGTLSLVAYSFVYTPLKRHSSVAVLIGAIPGALPVLIGAVAFDGSISALAIGLFFIQFLWQIPHFWSIGFLAFDDYQNAGFRFIPESNGKIHSSVMTQSVWASMVLLPVGVFVWLSLEVAVIYLVLYLILSGMFFALSINFYRSKNRQTALKLMLGSLVYLPVALAILLVSQI